MTKYRLLCHQRDTLNTIIEWATKAKETVALAIITELNREAEEEENKRRHPGCLQCRSPHDRIRLSRAGNRYPRTANDEPWSLLPDDRSIH